MDELELIIAGAGPAGITAGIYAARKKMRFSVLTADVGGQAAWTNDIENYSGFRFISGPDLVAKFGEHLSQFSIDLRTDEPVVSVRPGNGGFDIRTAKGSYRARTVIAASGRTPRRLGVEGEEAFRNRGVAFCATCDGPIFAGKDVLVAGGGNSGFYATLELLKFARRIYVAEAGPRPVADAVMVEKALASGKVEMMTGTTVRRIAGDTLVRSVEVESRGTRRELAVEGVFVEIGSTPNSAPFAGAALNAAGEIVVDCSCRTSVPGLFAAGDVTTVFAKQIICACGEGAKAAIAAFEHISRT